LLIADSQQIGHTDTMFKSERLDVWKKSIDFADLDYPKTKSFPPDERFCFTNQLNQLAKFCVN